MVIERFEIELRITVIYLIHFTLDTYVPRFTFPDVPLAGRNSSSTIFISLQVLSQYPQIIIIMSLSFSVSKLTP